MYNYIAYFLFMHLLDSIHVYVLGYCQVLEQTAVDNARVENEVMLLRKKIAQGLTKSNSTPNLVREPL